MERETLTRKGGYLKYWNNDWKGKRAGRLDGAKECRHILPKGNNISISIFYFSSKRQSGKFENLKQSGKGVKQGTLEGCNIFYNEADGRKNGIGIVVREEPAESVLEVKRVSDRLMAMKLGVKESILNRVSAYTPQVNNSMEEKNNFWQDLDGLIESVSKEERIVLGHNRHVSEGNIGDEEIMGRYGAGTRNKEGSMVVEFAKRMDLAIVNIYFKKKDEHRVTYKSGGKSTQVDYVMCRRRNLEEMCDCKIMVNECVAKQHRMVVCKMALMVKKKKAEKVKPKIQ